MRIGAPGLLVMLLVGASVTGCADLQQQVDSFGGLISASNPGSAKPADADASPIALADATSHPPDRLYDGAAWPSPVTQPALVPVVAGIPSSVLTSGPRARLLLGTVPASIDLAQLVGLNSDDVAARFGEPVLRRHEDVAELWQFRSRLCVVDFFLYPEGAGLRVAHADLRPTSHTAVSPQSCVGSFQQKDKLVGS